MTREEAIKWLEYHKQGEMGKAVEALDFGEKIEPIIDKIRDEIEKYKSRQLTLAIGVDDLEKGKQIALEYVLSILDKYKAEREVEDGNDD